MRSSPSYERLIGFELMMMIMMIMMMFAYKNYNISIV
jgi:hypothetical protein